jgi:hypothetical protein
VDEGVATVIAYATFVELQGGVAEFPGGHSGNADVNGHGFHVQAVLCHTAGTASQRVIRFRSAVSADDVDFTISMTY